MAIIVQACTLAGKIVEGARWEVEFPSGVQEGHLVALNVGFSDAALNGYLSRMPSPDCLVDKGPSGYSVALSFKVKQVRHMVEASRKGVSEAETMAIVQPVNRLVENVTLYIVSPARCDPKFLHGVRGSAEPRPTSSD
jgi:hypothetical protein